MVVIGNGISVFVVVLIYDKTAVELRTLCFNYPLDLPHIPSSFPFSSITTFYTRYLFEIPIFILSVESLDKT